MKTFLLLASVLIIGGSVRAQDFSAQQHQRKHVIVPEKVRPPAPYEGAIPRVIHSGNPLQMINPFAPKEYGSGAQLVSDERNEATQPVHHKGQPGLGIKVFSIEF